MEINDDEFTLMDNFHTLQTHLRIDCARFLGKILQKWHQDIDSLKKSETFGILDVESRAEILKRNSFVLSLPVLCDVLLKCQHEKVSEDESVSLLPPSSVQPFIDDIVLLDTIWKRYIIDNDNQMISSDDMQKLREMFESIGKGMTNRFSDLGEAYAKTIQRFRSQFTENSSSSVQIGETNTTKIKVDPKRQTDAPFFIEQYGETNYFIIQLDDRRQSRHLELRSSEDVKLRMVLRSNNTPEWREITENVLKLDISDLNSNPVLIENDIIVQCIEKGCIVVSFNTTSESSIKTSLKKLFDVLFRFLEVEKTLQKYSAPVIQVNGYIYCPEKFAEGQRSKKHQDVSIIRHLSWTNTTQNCDIDIYVTNLMKSLIQNEFSTDVDEQIELQIIWDIASDMESSPSTSSYDKSKLLSKELAGLGLEIKNVKECENKIVLNMKCTGKIAYSNFVKDGGQISIISRILFSHVPASFLILSVFLDTNFVNDSVSGQGLVFYLNPLSKVSDALATGKFSKIITAMLEGKDSSLMRNVEDVKIKAILEYCEDTAKEKHSPNKENTSKISSDRDVQSSTEDLMEQETDLDLFEACQMGNPNLVRRLLEDGRNPNARNEKLQSPLHVAAEGNHLRVVDHLLAVGANVNVLDENHDSPLTIASCKGHSKMITALLKKGADVEIVDKNNHTALYLAAEKGHHYALTNLLKFGAVVNSSSDNQVTPLHIACRKGYTNIVHDLLMYGADVQCIDEDFNTPLHTTLLHMVDSSHCILVVEELLNRGTLINKRNGEMKTPLCIASEKGLINVIPILLNAQADPNFSDNKNNLPLHLATKTNHIEIVEIVSRFSQNFDRCNAEGLTPRMLSQANEAMSKICEIFERKEDFGSVAYKFAKQGQKDKLLPFLKQIDYLNEKDPFGRSLLYVASCNGHLDIVRLLINSTLDVNDCDNLNRSPLSVAAENRYYSIVECLLEAGADSNKVDSLGRTALHYAIKSGSVDILSIILQHGHCVYREDNEGKTPLHFCAKYGNASMANVLLTSMVDINVNQCDLQIVSPLHEAIENQQLDVANTLLLHGADANMHDSNGRTPLHLAAENGSIAAVNILIKGGAQINERDNLFQTPIFLAAQSGRSVLKDLIVNEADLNLPGDKGRTPLYVSIHSRHLFAATILIQHNAIVNSADHEGKTPLHLATDLGNLELVDLLLKSGASVNAVDVNNRTPLHICTSSHVLTSLIQSGASINSKDNSGKTLLHYAIEYLCDSEKTSSKADEYLTIVNELLSHRANLCLCDDRMDTVIHKIVHASNYHLLTELLSFDFDLDIREMLINIANDCLKQSESEFVNDVLKRWLSIQLQKDNKQLECMYTQEREVCPSHLLHQHEEWLRQHKCLKRANVLRRVMSFEKDHDGKDGRKRKKSVGESTLIEPLEKMLRVQGQQD